MLTVLDPVSVLGAEADEVAPGPFAGFAPCEPLATLDPASWDGVEPPPRQWLLESSIPLGHLTLLTGPGSVGKSLLSQQLATCVAVGRPLLGIATQASPAIYLTCEDDEAELHRRQVAICQSIGVSLSSLHSRLHLIARTGHADNSLGAFGFDHAFQPSELLLRLRATARATGARLLVLDNVAHLFSGDENKRLEVAAFTNALNGLALDIGGAVLLLAHPSKAEAEYSGSTAWENQVRSRLFMAKPDPAEANAGDPDARVLKRSKANYSTTGDAARFVYHRGAFVLEGDLPMEVADTRAVTIAEQRDEERFLTCLDAANVSRRNVSHDKRALNYAPKAFRQMGEGQGASLRQLELAMERLFAKRLIVANAPLWRRGNSNHVYGIARRSPASRDGGRHHQGSPELVETIGTTVDHQSVAYATMVQPQPVENTATRVPPAECPIPKGITGAALGAAAPDKHPSGPGDVTGDTSNPGGAPCSR
jgi:RecA-family ATPase